jgi:hypothetical protein
MVQITRRRVSYFVMRNNCCGTGNVQLNTWINIGIALLAIFGWPAYDSWRQRSLQKEYDKNPQFDAPDTDQLKWDLRHIREDINLLCHLIFAVVVLLIVICCK